MRLSYLRISLVVALATAGARADSCHIKEATIADIQAAYRAGTLTPEQLVQMYLDRIKAFDRSEKPQPFGNGLSDQPLNSFMHVNDNALRDARRVDIGDAEDDADERPLAGIPVILKDNVSTKDMHTTAGSIASGSRSSARSRWAIRSRRRTPRSPRRSGRRAESSSARAR